MRNIARSKKFGAMNKCIVELEDDTYIILELHSTGIAASFQCKVSAVPKIAFGKSRYDADPLATLHKSEPRSYKQFFYDYLLKKGKKLP